MRRTWPQQLVSKVLPWVGPLLVVILWQIASQVGWLSSRVMPAPSDVLAAAGRLYASGELLNDLAVSARRAAEGFFIGGSIGFTLGLINGLLKPAELAFDTSLQMIRTIPILALIPLVIVWFGIGEESKLFLVSLSSVFPIYINTFHGIRNVDKGLIEMGRVYGLSPFELLWRIILPGALPSILVGVRFTLGVVWLTLIVAETISADSGLGYMAMNAREFFQTDVVVLSIVLYACLGKLSDLIARALESLLLQWHPSYRQVA